MKKLLLLFAALLLSLSLLAQNMGKVSVQMTGKPLAEVLTQIQAQSGYMFFFSRDAEQMQKKG